MDRRVVRIADSVVRIDQQIRIAGTEIATEISGPACIYAEVQIAAGSVAYLHGDSALDAPKTFAIFLPPFTVVQARLSACDVASVGLAFSAEGLGAIPSQPMLFARPAGVTPASRSELLRVLCEASGSVEVGRAPAPCPLAATAKQILDTDYFADAKLGHLANRMRTSSATLSRVFKRAYGVPPVRYRHQVRVMDALIRFAKGGVPADVSQDVGFQDLSRFYKIFRQVACDPPAVYRPTRSKNAKT